MARPPRPNVRSWLGCLLTGAASDRRFMRRTSLASERTRTGPFRGGRVRPPGGTGWTAAGVLNTRQALRRYSAAVVSRKPLDVGELVRQLGSSEPFRLLDVARGHLLAAGEATDEMELARRSRPLSLPAEIQWELLPRLALQAPEYAVAGTVEPAYDVGGDTFDHAAQPEA